jgi:hypothetical protein
MNQDTYETLIELTLARYNIWSPKTTREFAMKELFVSASVILTEDQGLTMIERAKEDLVRAILTNAKEKAEA